MVDGHPDAFERHVSVLLEKVINDRLAPYTIESHYASPSGSQLFRKLTAAYPEAVNDDLDDLFLIAKTKEPGAASELAVTILAELAVHHDQAAHQIRETAEDFLQTESADTKRRGALVLEQLFLKGDTQTEEIDALFQSLNASLSLPAAASICRTINCIQADQVDWSQRTERDLELLLQLSLGAQDWNTTDPSLEYTLEDTVTKNREEAVEIGNPTVSSRDFWALQKDALRIISKWAKARPNDVAPYLSWFLRSVFADRTGDMSLRIIESLCEADAQKLERFVVENHAEILDLLDHKNPQSRSAAIKLFTASLPDNVVSALNEIANDPSHPASGSVVNLLEGSPRGTDTSGANTVLRQLDQLPIDKTVILHLPSRSELRELYEQKSLVEMYETHYRSQIGELGFYEAFVTNLCTGNINPRLTELYTLYQYHTGEQSLPSFPTGPRLNAFREAAEMSVDDLSMASGIEASTIREIEESRIDPTAHTVEQLLEVLPNAESDSSYPDKLHPEQAWREHVMDVSEANGRLPTQKRASNQSDAPVVPFYTAYDGWNDLLESLPIENTYVTSNAPLRENLLAELQALHRELGTPPRVADIKEHGKYSYNYYKNEFGGIKNAREIAGVEQTKPEPGQRKDGSGGDDESHAVDEGEKPGQEDLAKALRELSGEIGGVPRTTDMNSKGRFSAATYYGEFDTWNDALAAAGIESDRSTRTTTDGDAKTELRAELQRLADELGKIPNTTYVKEHGKYSLGRYYSHYDSWEDAIDDAAIQFK